MTIDAVAGSTAGAAISRQASDPAPRGRASAVPGVGSARAATTGSDMPAPMAADPLQARRRQAEEARARELVERANDRLATTGVAIEFAVDEDSRRMVARVVDRQTKEVIRQIPSRTVLAVAQAIDRVIAGAIVDEQA